MSAHPTLAPSAVHLTSSQRRDAVMVWLSVTLLPVVGPLIYYLRCSHVPFVRENSRQALNFNVSYAIYFLALYLSYPASQPALWLFLAVTLAFSLLGVRAALRHTVYRAPGTWPLL